MKIALPYNTHFGEYNSDVVVGGIEKFCHQIVDLYEDVHIVNIDNDNESVRSNTDKIKSFAKDINADIIISNWHQASFTGAKIVDSEVPIMFVHHSGPSMGSTIGSILRLRANSHSCYFVSEHQQKRYQDMAKRLKADKIVIDGYINSSYVEGYKPKLQSIEYDCATIGRCDPVEKRPFLLKSYLKGTHYNSLIITNTPKIDKEKKYLERNSHWDGVVLDLNHSDVMKTIGKSMTYFSTCWDESWGITALEALSHGVPIILNSKDGTHASESIVGSKAHYRIVNKSSEQLISAIESLRQSDRQEIQDMTWEKHSLEKWKNEFANAIDKTVENFKKTP